MAFTRSLQLLTISAGLVAACPSLERRHGGSVTAADSIPVAKDWTYEASYDWHRQNPAWELCQTGTQQSPIPLRLDQGLALAHTLKFNYPAQVTGELFNWGYGQSFSIDHAEGDYSSLPSVSFEDKKQNETVYLASWHIHAPGDHTVQGDRSKAELHFVHHTADGNERAVLAFRINPGNSDSTFFGQLPALIHFNETDTRIPDVQMSISAALNEVNQFSDFWTYKGSLTSPPCKEGIRWFVARNVMYVSDEQMQNILRVSTYSARAEQEVWRHEINM